MKKKCLFLLVAFACTTEAVRAQDTPRTPEDVLKDYVDVDRNHLNGYEGLKTVMKNFDCLAELRDIVKEKQKTVNDLNTNKPRPQYLTEVKTDTTWTINEAYIHAKNFVNSYKKLSLEGWQVNPYQPSTLCYRIYADRKSGGTPKSYLYITIPDVSDKLEGAQLNLEGDAIGITNSVLTDDDKKKRAYSGWVDATWKEVNISDLVWEETAPDEEFSDDYVNKYDLDRTLNTNSIVPKIAKFVYLKKQKVKVADEEKIEEKFMVKMPEGESSYDRFGDCTQMLQTTIVSASDFEASFVYVTEETTEEKTLNPAYKEWSDELDVASEELTTANTAVTNFNASYKVETTNPETKTFTIASATDEDEVVDIIVPNAASEWTWPAGFTLNGGGNKVVGTQPLFVENNGNILNMIAPDGRIATDNNGKAKECIVKVTGGWRVYDDAGNYASDPETTLEDAVYKMRDLFGYDVVSGKATGKVTDGTKLYKATNTVTDKETSKLTTLNFNVNVDDNGKLQYDSSIGSKIKKDNTVVYIEDTNSTDAGTVIGRIEDENVAVFRGENDGYFCNKLVLKDATSGEECSEEEFYLPTAIQVGTLSYARVINQHKVAVCLPFALTATMKARIAEKVGTDVENVFYYKFSEVKDATKIWFSAKTTVQANEPCIIAFKDDVDLTAFKDGVDFQIFEGLTDLAIESTKDTDLSSVTTNTGEKCFFGNYKAKQLAHQLANAHNSGTCVYGFNNAGKLVLMVENAAQTDGTKLNQFRSCIILTEDLTVSSAAPTSLEIGFLDEDGNEVTGIGSVESGKNDNGFKAMGGNGVIEISAEKACDVKVYTASGSLVKAVRVEAGNTMLPFSAGMYIVNQMKVVVK